MEYQRTAAWVSGCVCGSLWWPVGELAGKPINVMLRGLHGGKWDRGGFDTFAECLDSILCEEGGDFSGAQFTEDTVIRIERKAYDGPYTWRVHVRARYLEICLALSFFRFDGESTLPPQAANASR